MAVAAWRRCAPRPGGGTARGFTLIELMMVLALVAIATGLVSLALRDPAAGRLEREGVRLAALLEAARAEARASGLSVVWQPGPFGPSSGGDARQAGADFRFVGLPTAYVLPSRWLEPGVVAQVVGARTLVLGPEPMIGAQRVVLRRDGASFVLETDGLGPFRLAEAAPAAAS